jgi:hypothetical protein
MRRYQVLLLRTTLNGRAWKVMRGATHLFPEAHATTVIPLPFHRVLHIRHLDPNAPLVPLFPSPHRP